MLSLIAAAGAASLILSLLLTLSVRALGRRRALLDTAGAGAHAKTGLRPVPNIGGVAVFWAVAAPMLAGLAAAWALGDGATLPAPIAGAAAHLPGVREQTPLALTLLGGLLVLHIVGLIDDRRALGAAPKLGVMAGAGFVVITAFDVRLLESLDAHVGGSWLSITLTLLWFVGVTNAMNFIDNMDGLSAGVGVVASAFFLLAALSQPAPQWFVGLTLALLIGALLGFLVFNAPIRAPASIFLGDGGSLVVGFLLAFLTVRTTYVDEAGPAPSAWYAVFMPLCVLAVPIYDLVSVSLVRLSQGRSPFVGDQQHLSHRLRRRGLTVRQTLAVIYGVTAVTGLAGVFLAHLGGWTAALAGAQVLIALGVLAVLEHGSAGRAA